MFDTPKETTVIDQLYAGGYRVDYLVQYKNRQFTVPNINIYPTQIDAEIFWAVMIREDYEKTLDYPDLFATDDYEIANLKAETIIKKYAESHPHLLLKYF